MTRWRGAGGAGELLGDPLLGGRSTADRTANLFAQLGLLGDEAGWFGEGLASWISDTSGEEPDRWKVLHGYPLGRSRPEFGDGVDIQVSGTSHTSLPELIASDFSQATLSQPPAQAYSLVGTTYLGELMQDPLRSYDEPNAATSRRVVQAAREIPIDLLATSSASDACEVVAAAAVVAADLEFRASISADLAFVLNDLDSTVASGFPAVSAWSIASGSPTVRCEVSGESDPAFALTENDAIAQSLDVASRDLPKIEFVVDAMLLAPDRALTLHVFGEGIDIHVPVGPPAGRSASARFTALAVVERQAEGGCFECPDAVRVASDGALVFDVRARAAAPVPCLGDLNADNLVNALDFNIFAGQFGAGPGATPAQGDLDADGFVGTSDFNILASSFGATCP